MKIVNYFFILYGHNDFRKQEIIIFNKLNTDIYGV